MPSFVYKARDRSGALVTGEVDSNDASLVKEAIAGQGLFPVSVELKSSQISVQTLFQKKPSAKDIANMTRQFQVMFAVGTPMDRILATLARQLRNPQLKDAMTRIQKAVSGGTRLGAAFRKYPQYFGPLYTSMLEVGEAGGVLDKTLKEMAAILEKENEIHTKVKSATLYPKIVVVALLVVSWVMLVFVIPPFKDFYSKNGAELPAPTRIMLLFSDIATTYWYLPILGGATAIWGFKKFAKTQMGIQMLSRLAFRIPIFGRMNILIANARFGHLTSALYRAGVPLSHALGVISNAMTNYYFSAEVKSLKNGLEQGRSISKCMEQTKYFEPMIQEACAVGETTGKLDDLLESAATFYDGEIDDILKNMSTLIEPILLVFLFAGVGMLALAVYLPVWNMSKVVLPN